jgi:hypothetical protein
MKRSVVFLIAGAAAFAMTGCGDDDDDGSGEVSEEAQPYVDAMIESFESADADELRLDRAQAECVAPRWVEIMQVERLQEAGIEPEDIAGDADPDLSTLGLSEADGNALYDTFGECDVDVQALFIESFAADDELSEEVKDCLAGAFDDDLLRRIMATTFVEGEDALDQDEELMGELFAVFSECPGAVQTD